MLDKFQLNHYSSKKVDVIISAVLTILILITRIPFVSKYLYEWDSVNYALGFEKFDIVHHQPHPPGYIFYIGLGRAVNTLFNDPNTTMIFISILFSIITVILIYFLAKQMFSRQFAIIASILLVFNPLFWYYGEISTIYPTQAFLATIVAYLSYQVFVGREKFFYPSIIALGIAGGFRQDLIIYMFPLWFFCAFYHKRDPNRLLKAILVLIPSVLVWVIPTMIFSGGYEQYSQASSTLYKIAFPRSSILFGSSIVNQLADIGSYVAWLGLGLTLSGIIIIALFNKYVGKGPKHIFRENIRNPKAIFLLLWFLPASIMYLLITLAKPGYMLVFVPALAIVLAYFVEGLSYSLSAKFKQYSPQKWIAIVLSLAIIFNAAYFLAPYPVNEETLWEKPINDLSAVDGVIWGLDTGLIFTNQKINSNDEATQEYLNAISQVPDSNPNNTIIAIGEITRTNEGFSWRKAMYYLPDYQIYYLIEADHFITSPWYAKNHTNTWLASNIFKIKVNSSTQKIIWIVSNQSNYFPQITSKIAVKTINLPDGQKLYYSDVNGTQIKNNELVFTGPEQY
jgi:4-amino-4-deoxy-L-arabinose transferase and related glycosyltransferases of PMT family